jgi:hypothetical protein
LTAFGGIAINTELQTHRSTATFLILIIVYSTGDRGSPEGIAMNPPNASVVSMPGFNAAGANSRR